MKIEHVAIWAKDIEKLKNFGPSPKELEKRVQVFRVYHG